MALGGFAKRPGTTAAKYVDDVPEEDKIRRLNRLIRLQQSIAYDSNQREIKRVDFALIEGFSRRSKEYQRARTSGNKTVLFKANGAKPGRVVPIRITAADAFTLHGQLEEVQ